jgi:hypothetical protein
MMLGEAILIQEMEVSVQKLGIDAENHAREIKYTAARRMGELCPATPPEETGRGKKLSAERIVSDIVPKQRLSEFRKLAEIPGDKFSA